MAVLCAAWAISSCDRNVPDNGPDNPSDTTQVTPGGDTTGVNPGVESITIDPGTLELTVGQTGQLKALAEPEDVTGYTVVWSSSDESVATVSQDGLVTAVKEGNASITAAVADVSAVASVRVKAKVQLADPEVGDYFYSDGTWSTDLATDKEVIGIVFWTGDPTEDDPSLKREHPDCTHGLVCAVNGEKLTSWQRNYKAYKSDPNMLNLYNGYVSPWIEKNTEYEGILTANSPDYTKYETLKRGYNNTAGLIEFNRQPGNKQWPINVAEDCSDYRKAVPAPSNTSDWYIPSAMELLIMFSEEAESDFTTLGDYTSYELRDLNNMYMINERLEGIEGAQALASVRGVDTDGNPLDMAFYITCCEYPYPKESNHYVYGLGVSDYISVMTTEPKASTVGLINDVTRFILAF
ncbi:MAG TPA: Ig-like domain-containing protein [Candidatus Coprenecus pullistercoris]|nr:Ig-like domain-containing protein [Candidatus Coprenecus pullistercoris]